MDKTQARIAARWWSDCLRNGAPMDNGDTSDIGVMGRFMAEGLQASRISQIDTRDIGTFELVLTNLIASVPDDQAEWFQLGVDYHACQMLVHAGKVAGIDLDFGVLPFKTHMRFDKKGNVYVSSGYRAHEEKLTQEPNDA